MAKKKITVLITTDFYAEYELYKTDDIDDLKHVTKLMVNGDDVIEPDPAHHKLIGSNLGTGKDIDTQTAIKMADEIIYLSDYETE